MEEPARKSGAFWIVGFLAEAFSAHPILTSALGLGFVFGGAYGIWAGYGVYGILGALAGWAIGGIVGLILIALLYGLLLAIGLAG